MAQMTWQGRSMMAIMLLTMGGLVICSCAGAPAKNRLGAFTPAHARAAPEAAKPVPAVTHALTGRSPLTADVTAVPTMPQPAQGAPQIGGQVIVVSLTQQWLWVYANRQLVFNSPIASGRPELPTPIGTYHVLTKNRDLVFHSPWGPGSPYYYTPEHINYALYFRAAGFYIHDAPWRQSFGPGSEAPHTNPDGSQETGSHGCVNVPTATGAWLFDTIQVGATIIIG
jgi:lipoprotein-anchoring transpeptidase ErfK/SrfK